MKNEGRFWPTEKDKMPRSEDFHVGDSAVDISGVTTFVVTEIPSETEARLRKDFVVYRAAKSCQRLVKEVVGIYEV